MGAVWRGSRKDRIAGRRLAAIPPPSGTLCAVWRGSRKDRIAGRRLAAIPPAGRLCYSGSVLAIHECNAGQEAAWDAFVAQHPHGHFLQSWAWGRLRERWGWRALRLAAVADDGARVAAAQVLVRRSLAGSLAYVPRGPACAPCDPAWSALRWAIRQRLPGLVALRFEPHWPEEPATRAWLREQGLRPAPAVQPPSTVRIDLRAGDEALLAAMKQKWRYNIRLAERRGVTVRRGSQIDLETFYALLCETARRDAFAIRPAEYYRAVWHELAEAGRLYLAERGAEPLAAILVVHFGGTATYLYGASAGNGREHMPNHLLQWQAMRWARQEGLTVYDLWGIPDAIGQAVLAGSAADDVPVGSGGLWGVWGFKRGFGGTVWRTVGAWDDVVALVRYRLGRWWTHLRSARREGE